MTNYKKQIFSVLASGVMLLNVATPALASTTIEISGNGAGSENWATVGQSNTTTVSQSNTANVNNTVNADAKTGGNDANFNTGGQVGISTGDAAVKTNIQNNLNSNAASVDCCAAGSTDVKISGNGAYSDNGVVLDASTTTTVNQANTANVNNTVNADAKTGGNTASKNTGGDVLIGTGNAKVESWISTTANVNSATVGGGMPGAGNPSASFVISGNGAGSDNYITAALANLTEVEQENVANINNIVDADATTGENDANFNTGGDVLIGTGHAVVKTDIDNAVNFNHADVDCGCTWDVLAKISGNGADTDHHWWDEADNIITLELANAQAVGQGNVAELNNTVDDSDAKTGYNEALSNTGEVDSDPAIVTGDAYNSNGISNSGNVNVVGDMPFDFPDMPEVEFSFNFAALWAFFGMSN
jgi:hypothetical protein